MTVKISGRSHRWSFSLFQFRRFGAIVGAVRDVHTYVRTYIYIYLATGKSLKATHNPEMVPTTDPLVDTSTSLPPTPLLP